MICWLLGHKMRWAPLRYFGMWCCDERCARCGADGPWWPQ